jgi:hypothetical protein
MNPARSHNSQREIAAFLQALSTYPEHFQENPLLSFEQHMVRVADEHRTLATHASAR